MTSTTVLNLNLQRPNYAVAMYAVQYDKMSRKITAHLYDGDTPFTPNFNSDGVVRCHKADGTVCFYDVLEDESTPAVTWSGNVATIWLAEQALTCAGNMLCQVQFYTGTERLTTFTFIINVQENAVTDNDIASTDYFSILTQQIQAILDVVENMPAPATELPLMDGTASIGIKGEFARSDHVHPTDTSLKNTSASGYIMTPDGTAICWGRITVSNIAITTAWGSLYESALQSTNINYPITFVGSPSVTANANVSPTAWIETLNSTDTGIAGYYLVRPTATDSTSGKISWIAIGRWK